VLVSFDAGGENLFGVDASLSVSYGPNCSLHGSSHCFFLAMFATRHNSAFLNLKNWMQAGFLAVESAKRRKIDHNRRDLFVTGWFKYVWYLRPMNRTWREIPDLQNVWLLQNCPCAEDAHEWLWLINFPTQQTTHVFIKSFCWIIFVHKFSNIQFCNWSTELTLYHWLWTLAFSDNRVWI
jgi:hypothetical protein